ncbi:MAG TPA: hypothetical protein PK733_07165 [Clostridiales bacterium]|nr:hypothetical protein [Clostridiales bacterium]
MDILEDFREDGDRVIQRYIEIHKLHKEREHYIYHASHETLDIRDKKWTEVWL